jgi:hypothetical protein
MPVLELNNGHCEGLKLDCNNSMIFFIQSIQVWSKVKNTKKFAGL